MGERGRKKTGELVRVPNTPALHVTGSTNKVTKTHTEGRQGGDGRTWLESYVVNS